MSKDLEDSKSVNVDSGFREHIPSSLNFNNLFIGDILKMTTSKIKSTTQTNELFNLKNNLVPKKKQIKEKRKTMIIDRIFNQNVIETPFNLNKENAEGRTFNTDRGIPYLPQKGSNYTDSNSTKKYFDNNINELETNFLKNFLLIQDKCYFAFERYEEKNVYQKTKNKLCMLMKFLFQNLNAKFLVCMKIAKSLFMNLSSEERIEKLFNLLFFFIIIFFSIFLPFEFAFCQEECGKEIIIFAFVLNFLEIKFRSNQINCKKRNYWSINFGLDFLKTISFLMYVLKISKIFGIIVFILNFRNYIYYEGKLNHPIKKSLVDFLLIILKILVGFGTFASIWFYVKEDDRMEGDISNYSNFLKYINVVNNLMHFSIFEMPNIKDYFEAIFIFCLRLFSLYAIGLLLFFYRMYSSERKITKDRAMMEEFFEKYNLQKKLRKRILFKRQNDIYPFIMKGLNTQTKNIFLKNCFGHLFYGQEILNKNFSEEFLEHLLSKINRKHFLKNEWIFKKKENTEQKLYFIEEGEVKLMSLNEKLLLKSLKKGDIFCECEFFAEFHSQYSARVTKETTILYLKKRDFLELLKKYPIDKESYTMLRQRITHPQFHSNNLYPCYFCRDNRNIFSVCPFQHYHPFVERKYLTHNEKQERKPYPRRRNTKFNVLRDLDMIQRGFQYFKEFSPESQTDELLTESHDSNYKNDRESKNFEILATTPSIFLQSMVATNPKKINSSSSIFENENEDEHDLTANDNECSRRFFSNTHQFSSSIEGPEASAQSHPDEMKNEMKYGTTCSTSVLTEKFHCSEKESIGAAPLLSHSTNHNENQIMFSVDYSRFMEKEYTTTSNLNGDSNPEAYNLLRPYAKKKNSKLNSFKSNNSYGKKIKKIDSYHSNHNRKPTYEEFIKYPLFWFEFERMKNFKKFFLENNAENVINNCNNITCQI